MVAKELTLLIANFRTLVNIQVVMSFPFPKKTGSQWGGCCTTQSSGCAYRVSRPVMEVSVYPDHSVNHLLIAHICCWISFIHMIYRFKILSKFLRISWSTRQIYFIFCSQHRWRWEPNNYNHFTKYVQVLMLLSCSYYYVL